MNFILGVYLGWLLGINQKSALSKLFNAAPSAPREPLPPLQRMVLAAFAAPLAVWCAFGFYNDYRSSKTLSASLVDLGMKGSAADGFFSGYQIFLVVVAALLSVLFLVGLFIALKQWLESRKNV